MMHVCQKGLKSYGEMNPALLISSVSSPKLISVSVITGRGRYRPGSVMKRRVRKIVDWLRRS
jgi:DNA-nicking Smr family endonuclease